MKKPANNTTSKRLVAHLAAGLCSILIVANASAEVALAPLFRDNAVLQRDKPLPVWGRAKPGEKVTVSFRAQKVTGETDSQGCWRVTLAAMPTSAKPADMIVSGENILTVRNVLVGEVWLCSGQSNMAWLVKSSANPDGEANAANHPLIRHFKVPLVAENAPAEDCGGEWTVCSPQSVSEFSAVAYYFGRELHQKLGVPIGLINSSWGGTAIESWMNNQALAADPAGPKVAARWHEDLLSYPGRVETHEKALKKWEKDSAAAKKAGKKSPRRPAGPEGAGTRREPSSLYNAMIAPLLPYALRGVIWYQGEANAARYAEYRTLFPSMIKQWRADFRQGDMPFYYVQLAAFDNNAPWAFQREAQQCALKLPATGEAVAIDIGEAKNIHPKNKQEAGRRLALNALAGTYGKTVEFSGPVHAGITKEKNALRVKFTHAAGLKTKDAAMPGFEIAGPDRVFVSAIARIEGESVIVSAPGIANPVAVRYAWASNPPAPLYNSADLPASPFRSDDWEK